MELVEKEMRIIKLFVIRHDLSTMFSQRLDIDYKEKYSPVVDVTHFFLNLAVNEQLETRLVDVFMAYLYRSLDNNIYMKISEGLYLLKGHNPCSRVLNSIKLCKSLYGLEQARWMCITSFGNFTLRY